MGFTVVGCQLSVMSCRLWVVELAVVGCQLSVMSCRFWIMAVVVTSSGWIISSGCIEKWVSVVGYRLSVIGYQLSVVSYSRGYEK